MPILARFFGLVIKMFFSDHPPPHFHVEYGEQKAMIAIETGELLKGNLSPRALRLVEEWRKLHIRDLQEDWELAKNKQLPKPIAPLE